MNTASSVIKRLLNLRKGTVIISDLIILLDFHPNDNLKNYYYQMAKGRLKYHWYTTSLYLYTHIRQCYCNIRLKMKWHCFILKKDYRWLSPMHFTKAFKIYPWGTAKDIKGKVKEYKNLICQIMRKFESTYQPYMASFSLLPSGFRICLHSKLDYTSLQKP